MVTSKGIGIRSLALAWLLVVAITTLTGAPEQSARIAETSWSCLACGDAGLTDVLLNLLLFLPLGLLARAAGWSLRRTIPPLLLLTIGIEVTQATLLSGRDASLSDVLANTGGGILGWLVLPAVAKSLNPSRSLALRTAFAVLGVSGLVWVLTGVGLQVALSPRAPWVGQPLHIWPNHEPFRGSLRQATIAGIPIPNDSLAEVPALDSLDLSVAVTRSDTIAAQLPVSILRIVDAHQQLQLSLSARGEKLQLEHRVTASNWLLRTPTWEFAGAYTIPANTPWRWHFLRRADSIVLQSGPVAGPATERALPVSLGLGWAFIHPFAPAVGAGAIWWSALWVGWWLGLLGWFAGWVGARTAIGFAGAGIAAMLSASALTGVPVRLAELSIAAIAYALFAVLALKGRGEHTN